MSTREQVFQLLETLRQAKSLPSEVLDVEEGIRNVERMIGKSLPADLNDWFHVCEGIFLRGATLLSVRRGAGFTDVADTLIIFTEWQENGFVPIANDGCGNYYLVDCTAVNGFYPIYFFDHEYALRDPQCTVASSLWIFLEGIISIEITSDEHSIPLWPLDPYSPYTLLENDPDLPAAAQKFPLPWDVEERVVW